MTQPAPEVPTEGDERAAMMTQPPPEVATEDVHGQNEAVAEAEHQAGAEHRAEVEPQAEDYHPRDLAVDWRQWISPSPKSLWLPVAHSYACNRA